MTQPSVWLVVVGGLIAFASTMTGTLLTMWATERREQRSRRNQELREINKDFNENLVQLQREIGLLFSWSFRRYKSRLDESDLSRRQSITNKYMLSRLMVEAVNVRISDANLSESIREYVKVCEKVFACKSKEEYQELIDECARTLESCLKVSGSLYRRLPNE